MALDGISSSRPLTWAEATAPVREQESYEAGASDLRSTRNWSVGLAAAGAVAAVVSSVVLGVEWSHLLQSHEHIGAWATGAASVMGTAIMIGFLLRAYNANKEMLLKQKRAAEEEPRIDDAIRNYIDGLKRLSPTPSSEAGETPQLGVSLQPVDHERQPLLDR